MNAVLEQFEKIGIIPVIAIPDAKDAVPLAKALIRGGLPCAEVTFRTAAGRDAIKAMAQECPEMLVGAGTVLSVEQVDQAIEAGAKFIVSPGFNRKVVEHCLERGIPVTPGTSCPSDMEAAMELGLDVVKFFPASQLGGVPMLKAVSGPYPNLRFMPTGGVNAGNITEFLDFKKILACGGTWMVKPDMISAGEFDKIEQLTREAVRTMLGLKLTRVTVRTEDAAEEAAKLCKLLGIPCEETACGAAKAGECLALRGQTRGEKGDLVIQTNYMKRALYHLELEGYEFDYGSAKVCEKCGDITEIYLKDTVAGFAVCLVQK